MLSNTDALQDFFNRVVEGFKQDAEAKKQKIPVSSFRSEADEIGGRLYAAPHFKYLVTGRGPGKFPPPEAMLAYVRANPDQLARAKQVFKYITENSLAYLIGRKIAQQGTDIHEGKKPGIDFLGVLETNMPELLAQLSRNESVKIITDIKQAIQ